MESSTGSAFNGDTTDQRLDWNPSFGLEGLTTGEVLSPASVLVHELNHFNLWSKDKGITIQAYRDTTLENGDTLDEYVAMEAEVKANNGVVVRNDYNDAKPIVTQGATSKTKVKDYVKPEFLKKQEEKNKQIEEDIRKSILEAQKKS